MSDNRHEELARRLLDQPPSQWPAEIAPLRVEIRSMPPALRAKLEGLNKAAVSVEKKPLSLFRRPSFRIAASFGTALAASIIVYFAFLGNRPVAPATIVSADGDVMRNGVPAKNGDRISESEVVKVGVESLAVVSAEHNGIQENLRIQSESEVALETLQTGLLDFRLKVGRLLAQVPKKKERGSREFWISTPTSVASVRGTVFSMEATPSGDSTLSTYEGTVTFRRRWEALEDLAPDLISKSEILAGSVKIFEKASVNVEASQQSTVTDQDFKDRLDQIGPLNSVLSKPAFVSLRKKKNPSKEEIRAALKILDEAFASPHARATVLKSVETAFGQAPSVDGRTAEEMKLRRESFEALSAKERQAKYEELRSMQLDREAFKRQAAQLMGKAPQEVILKNGERLFGTIFGENGRYRVYTATEARLVSPEEVEEILFE